VARNCHAVQIREVLSARGVILKSFLDFQARNTRALAFSRQPVQKDGNNKGEGMQAFLIFSRGVDKVSEAIGKFAGYVVLACCLVSAGNAAVRYTFNYSSNAWLEIQWYMFAFVVLLGAAHTLRNNEHVRVDLIYGSVSPRKRLWIDVIGIIFFLLPACLYLAWLSWPVFLLSFKESEISANAGGLIRWPVKLIIVAGFVLIALQGVSELIKRIAGLTGALDIDTTYEKPLQ
jgi:TRAP-type mannitol/chloroaromatic compound transport system permease small subunit